jgi:hypothetical protein
MIYDRNRSYFAYSAHKTRDAANDALEQYFADGRICESEQPYVEKCGKKWFVWFPGS